MAMPPDVEYRVVLVFPGYGTERENAEEIVEEALDYLNTHRDKPGFRFAPYVTARLEIVPDLEQAQAKMETDDGVAMLILHDLDDEERNDFTRECNARDVPVCQTVPAPDQPRKPRRRGEPWKIVFKKRSEDDDAPRAHTITEATLTAPLEDDEDVLIDRVQQLIAVMALGVMEYHWRRQPPRFLFSE
jgi:hypothetical protein